MCSPSHLNILHQWQHLAVSMLCNKNTFYSEFSYLVLYGDVCQHHCSICKQCEEFSGSLPTAWRRSVSYLEAVQSV